MTNIPHLREVAERYRRLMRQNPRDTLAAWRAESAEAELDAAIDARDAAAMADVQPAAAA